MHKQKFPAEIKIRIVQSKLEGGAVKGAVKIYAQNCLQAPAE